MGVPYHKTATFQIDLTPWILGLKNRRRAVSSDSTGPDPHSPPPVHYTKKPLKYSTAKWVLKKIKNKFATDIVFNGSICGTN